MRQFATLPVACTCAADQKTGETTSMPFTSGVNIAFPDPLGVGKCVTVKVGRAGRNCGGAAGPRGRSGGRGDRDSRIGKPCSPLAPRWTIAGPGKLILGPTGCAGGVAALGSTAASACETCAREAIANIHTPRDNGAHANHEVSAICPFSAL